MRARSQLRRRSPGSYDGTRGFQDSIHATVEDLLWNGPPRRLIELAIEGDVVELFSSPVLLDELVHTLGYAKFADRIQTSATNVAKLTAQYATMVSVVIPTFVPRMVTSDADDDHVIAAAVTARAKWIVTGDLKLLLPIDSHQGIAIISACEAVERIKALYQELARAVRPSLRYRKTSTDT